MSLLLPKGTTSVPFDFVQKSFNYRGNDKNKLFIRRGVGLGKYQRFPFVNNSTHLILLHPQMINNGFFLSD
jgi:hypothetical protein